MALDYYILAEDDVGIQTLIARLSASVPLEVLRDTGLELVASDKEGSVSLWMKRGLSEGEVFSEFIDYRPRTNVLIKLDKEDRQHGKRQLVRITSALLEITTGAITVLMHGELLLLGRKKGETAKLYTPDFWTDQIKAAIGMPNALVLS